MVEINVLYAGIQRRSFKGCENVCKESLNAIISLQAHKFTTNLDMTYPFPVESELLFYLSGGKMIQIGSELKPAVFEE